jgi:hypothetical protein
MLLDGGQVGTVGAQPFELTGVVPGLHRVRVDFDAGGSREEKVQVMAGQTADVRINVSTAREMFAFREGVNFGVSAGGGVIVGGYGSEQVGGGGSAQFVLNVGIVPAVDFRTGVDAFAGYWASNDGGFALFVGAPARFELNMGSIFGMMIGVELGFYWAAIAQSWDQPGVEQAPGFWFGPTASIAKFRFGDRRQFELGQVTTLGVAPTIDKGNLGIALRNDLAFTWLILPEQP